MSSLTSNSSENISLLKQLCEDLIPNPILRDLTICQGILESRLAGIPSGLAINHNNLFGIKGEGTAGSVTLPTHEFFEGAMHEVNASFAANNSVEDSILQHAKLLEEPRYARVAACTTFEEAAQAIKDCGYATDPGYPHELMIEYNKYIIKSPN